MAEGKNAQPWGRLEARHNNGCVLARGGRGRSGGGKPVKRGGGLTMDHGKVEPDRRYEHADEGLSASYKPAS